MTWKAWKDLNNLDKYMLFIALFGKLFLFVTIAKIIIDESSENVSFTAYVLYVITSLSWFIFGLYYKETLVTFSSLLGLAGGLLTMNIVVAYKENKTDLF
jgi:uncharacterized protein with PQ loop repeat